MTIPENIKKRLQKLLALSASSNENEANSAMQKAQALMAKYNLRIADVASDGSGAHVKHQEVVGSTRQKAQWESNLAWRIAECFDGRAIQSSISKDSFKNGWKMTFIAGRSDLEIIIDLYERLRKTIPRMSDAFVEEQRRLGNRTHAKSLHNSYRQGLVATIYARLKQLQANTRPDPLRPVSPVGMTGKDLMIVKEKAIDQRLKRLFPRVSRARIPSSVSNGSAFNRGRADGHNVSLHRSVKGGNGPTLLS